MDVTAGRYITYSSYCSKVTGSKGNGDIDPEKQLIHNILKTSESSSASASGAMNDVIRIFRHLAMCFAPAVRCLGQDPIKDLGS